MAPKPAPIHDERVAISGLADIADRAQQMLMNLRDDLLEPHPRKVSPMFSSSKVAKLCGIERVDLNYLCGRGYKGGYPTGQLIGKNRARMFTLEETQEFVRANGKFRPRPLGQRAIALAVGNFKGGVGKTTGSVAFAQGFTLRGYKVLLIDIDPQGSSTTLMGFVPDAEISPTMSVLPAVYGDQPDLQYAVIPSYWHGLDLIPACPALAGADYFLPNKQAENPNFEFWKVLDDTLEPLRDKYDIILIDTPPTLSYLAIGAFMATDGLIVPVPPETLDYASSTQFFRQFADLFKSLQKENAVEKTFSFIKIVLSKVKSSAATTAVVRSWIQKTYPGLVATNELIETDIVMNASAEFQTLYDIAQYDGNKRTLDRALESFDAVVSEIESSVQSAWQVRVHESEAQHV